MVILLYTLGLRILNRYIYFWMNEFFKIFPDGTIVYYFADSRTT